MEFFYDTNEYPTHIIIPEDYWVSSYNIEYSFKENNDD